MENVAERASRIRDSLLSMGSLNLWEVRAILNERRDTAFQVLFWMASRREISYTLEGEQLQVTLCGTGRKAGPWKNPRREWTPV